MISILIFYQSKKESYIPRHLKFNFYDVNNNRMEFMRLPTMGPGERITKNEIFISAQMSNSLWDNETQQHYDPIEVKTFEKYGFDQLLKSTPEFKNVDQTFIDEETGRPYIVRTYNIVVRPRNLIEQPLTWTDKTQHALLS